MRRILNALTRSRYRDTSRNGGKNLRVFARMRVTDDVAVGMASCGWFFCCSPPEPFGAHIFHDITCHVSNLVSVGGTGGHV